MVRAGLLARLTRAAAVSALIAAGPGAPPAAAVEPPPIDRTRLPAAAPPAPPRPTVQRDVCTVPTLDRQLAAAPTQLDGLDLPAAWALSRGAGQRVAVIDTGVAAHRRLPGLVGGGDYVFTGDGTQDCDGHGTLVAGIIAAAAEPASDRFSGVAPQATVIGIRQSSSRFSVVGDAAQTGVGDVDTLAEAVRTAADLGASVINISTVACRPADAELDDRALGAALAYAVETRNVVVVAAAGNSGGGEACRAGPGGAITVSPAWYDDYVLTVGSVDARGAASSFSLPGSWVDVAAPGEAVLSLSPVGDSTANTVGGGHGTIYGTSFAAPVVSGLVALIRSRFPDWTPRQVMDRIKATAHHPPGGRDDVVGAGVIDPLAALSVDAPPAGRPPRPEPVPVSGNPASAAVPSKAPAAAPSGPRTAVGGTAALLVVLLAGITGRALASRARHPG